jgi:hypothetical protein
MFIDVSTASTKQLDWLVASCDDHNPCLFKIDGEPVWVGMESLRYSTNWSHGGPIIEREGMTIEFIPTIGWRACVEFVDCNSAESVGSATPLIAAMRCYVILKRGSMVEIPDDLVE